MKNQFAEEYQQHTALLAQYRAAEAADDKDAMDQARKERLELTARIKEKGVAYSRFYDKYASAQKRGNEYIDWNDVIWDKDVTAFVEDLREYGIEKFVFSSSWSSAVDTAWLLQQNGCKLEGLVEINGTDYVYTDEYWSEFVYQKAHGYLFSVC